MTSGRDDTIAAQALPSFGARVKVAEGIFQVRLPIPFALDHVNVYLLRDGDGWVVVDTGTNSRKIQSIWRDLLASLDGPVRRIIITHHHIDHAGAVRFLAEETGAPVIMTPLERNALAFSLEPYAQDIVERMSRYYTTLGCDAAEALAVADMRLDVDAFVGGMPERIETIVSGDTIRIGSHDWQVETGAGHTWESLIARRSDGRVAIIGDQLLTHISPFIGIFQNSYDKNPLATYYAFLARMRNELPQETVLLPGHRPVFSGGAARAGELAAHHDARCAKIVSACSERSHTVRSLVDVLFDRDLTDVMILALAETMAHVTYLASNRALRQSDNDGVMRYTSV